VWGKEVTEETVEGFPLFDSGEARAEGERRYLLFTHSTTCHIRAVHTLVALLDERPAVDHLIDDKSCEIPS